MYRMNASQIPDEMLFYSAMAVILMMLVGVLGFYVST